MQHKWPAAALSPSVTSLSLLPLSPAVGHDTPCSNSNRKMMAGHCSGTDSFPQMGDPFVFACAKSCLPISVQCHAQAFFFRHSKQKRFRTLLWHRLFSTNGRSFCFCLCKVMPANICTMPRSGLLLPALKAKALSWQPWGLNFMELALAASVPACLLILLPRGAACAIQAALLSPLAFSCSGLRKDLQAYTARKTVLFDLLCGGIVRRLLDMLCTTCQPPA